MTQKKKPTNLGTPIVKECIEFLEKYKQYVGLAGWKMLVSVSKTEDDNLAEAGADILNKTITVKIPVSTLKLEKPALYNILFHELVHVRICITQQRTRVLVDQEEETLANDITTGFETVFNRWKE